ncbi:MAG: hypothetical protein WA799_08960 [Nitrosotalea sp.]
MTLTTITYRNKTTIHGIFTSDGNKEKAMESFKNIIGEVDEIFSVEEKN